MVDIKSATGRRVSVTHGRRGANSIVDIDLGRPIERGADFLVSLKAQDLFDALRAAGFTDKPKTELDKIKDAVRELKAGQRFKFLGTDTIYVRDYSDTFTDTGENSVLWNYGTITIESISNTSFRGVKVLPDLPSGDEKVSAMTPGTKFTVDGATLVRTSGGWAVDLADGAVYGSAYFRDRNVVVTGNTN